MRFSKCGGCSGGGSALLHSISGITVPDRDLLSVGWLQQSSRLRQREPLLSFPSSGSSTEMARLNIGEAFQKTPQPEHRLDSCQRPCRSAEGSAYMPEHFQWVPKIERGEWLRPWKLNRFVARCPSCPAGLRPTRTSFIVSTACRTGESFELAVMPVLSRCHRCMLRNCDPT